MLHGVLAARQSQGAALFYRGCPETEAAEGTELSPCTACCVLWYPQFLVSTPSYPRLLLPLSKCGSGRRKECCLRLYCGLQRLCASSISAAHLAPKHVCITCEVQSGACSHLSKRAVYDL